MCNGVDLRVSKSRMPFGSWGVTMMTRTLSALAALFAATALANAADLAIPAPGYVPTWTGCYVGGNAGYGTAAATSYYAYPVSPVIDPNGHFTTATFIQDFSNKGFLGGAQLGCQQQLGRFLWGVEGDWASFDNATSHSFSSGFDEGGGTTFSQTFNQSLSYTSLWSVRGRFGVILSDAYHLYATAGVGGATAKYTSTASINETTAGVCTCVSINTAVRLNPTGFVLGAGAEWKVWSNVVVGVEYLHYMLESDTIIPIKQDSLNPLIGLGNHVRTNNVDTVRLRASWLFSSGL
jgi:outer membrane immunogenic protein